MSHSQNEEEKFILEATRRIDPSEGRFLDIGAWNPRDLSNTRALYELGWSGLMVEPSPEPFLGLLREYGPENRIQLLCGSVGVLSEITRFHATADALTTSRDANFELWKDRGGFYGSFFSNSVTFSQIRDSFGDFDFVSIDAEGTSVDLFHELLATDMRPACICVEYDDRGMECTDAGTAKGYRILYTSGENVVFGR